MQTDAELMLLFAGLHLIGLVLVAALVVMLLRSETVRPWSPPKHGGGGGASDRPPPRPDGGGPPLPDAVPARHRLRDHGRPARPVLPRRRAREPERAPLSSSPRARSAR